jgi:serine protease Do
MKLSFVHPVLVGALVLGCGGASAHAAKNKFDAPAPFSSPPTVAGQLDVATLAAKVKPAVVNIMVSTAIKRSRVEMDFPFPFMVPRGRRGGPGPGEDMFRQQGVGTGFIVDPDGHVVTNAHVVEGADQVRVKLDDDREFDATVRGRDERLDLAVLELKGAKNLPSVAFGQSDELRIGEYVVAIGNPFGLSHTVTMGIVSAKSRTIGAGPYDDFIQTDAAINPGNSGGPLFNTRGQVVGINTAINPAGSGIGFAIPVDALKDVLPQLLEKGSVSRGRLGALVQPVEPSVAKALGLDKPTGALVAEVERGSAGEKAGLQPGDLITKVNGTEVKRSSELPRLVARNAPGSTVTLTVLRDKKERSLRATLDAIPDSERRTKSSPVAPSGRPTTNVAGMQLSDATGGGARVEDTADGSTADDVLEPGDVILEVNRKPVERAADVQKAVEALPTGEPILMKVRRDGKVRFVAIERR